jgi:hypothetical protein
LPLSAFEVTGVIQHGAMKPGAVMTVTSGLKVLLIPVDIDLSRLTGTGRRPGICVKNFREALRIAEAPVILSTCFPQL